MTAPPAPAPPPTAPQTAPWLLFVILGSLSAFMPVAMDMYLPALPEIGRAFGADTGTAQLTLSSFFIGVAAGQFLYGPASDRFGRRPPLFIGATLFVAASLGCAIAPSMETLIGLRFLQGLGASCGMVIVRAIVFESFGVREGARYMSQLMLIMGIAPILAPMVGGWIVVHADWRTVFHIVGAFAAIILVASFIWLPETRSEATAAVARGESTLQSCLAVIGNGPLMRMAIISALGSAGFFTYLSNAPGLLIDIFGIPPDQFGYYFGANAFAFIGAAQLNRAVLARLHPSSVLNWSVWVLFGLSLLLLAGALLLPVLGMFGVLTPLFFLMGAFPFMNQNAAAVAQGYDLTRTGAVSAVLGAIAMLSGAALASLSGALHNGTPIPMALTISLTAGAALLLRLTGPKPSH